MNKLLVKERFQGAQDTYDKNASIQADMAIRLVEVLKGQGMNFSRIWEIGSGTGLLTKSLVREFAPETLHLSDLYLARNLEEYLKLLKGLKLFFSQGDAETLPVPEGPWDLIAAGSVFQWFESLPDFIARVETTLVPGGLMGFTTFLPGHFREVRDITGLGLNYRTRADLEGCFIGSFYPIHSEIRELVLHFSSPGEILRHCRLTGVNALESDLWPPGRVRHFCQAYEALKTPHGYPLSQKTYLGIFRKKPEV